MERDRDLVFTPVNHPDPRVRQVGFDLTDTYVEQCWSAVVGPSATLLLRRLPELWQREVPARVPAGEFSQSLGLGAGTEPNSRLASTMDRLVRVGLARPVRAGGLDVFLEVPPLQPRQLERVPGWTRSTHERLFTAHLDGFEGVAEHRSKVNAATVDLQQFRQRATHTEVATNSHQQALGR
jgi:hypothetical protein